MNEEYEKINQIKNELKKSCFLTLFEDKEFDIKDSDIKDLLSYDKALIDSNEELEKNIENLNILYEQTKEALDYSNEVNILLENLNISKDNEIQNLKKLLQNYIYLI